MGEGGLALNIRDMIVNSSIDKKIALLGRGVARIELMQVYRLEPRPVDCNLLDYISDHMMNFCANNVFLRI